MVPLSTNPSGRAAFSLVEVVIALGIAAFVIVAIVGLLPVGLRLASDSTDETRCVNILGAIASDRLTSAPNAASILYGIPALTPGQTSVATGSFGVTEAGTSTLQDWAKARYRVSYRLQPPESGRLDPWLLSLRISWPAQSTNTGNSVESLIAVPE